MLNPRGRQRLWRGDRPVDRIVVECVVFPDDVERKAPKIAHCILVNPRGLFFRRAGDEIFAPLVILQPVAARPLAEG